MLKDNEKKMHLFVVRDLYSFPCILRKVECKPNISQIFYQSQKHLLSILAAMEKVASFKITGLQQVS